MIAGLPTLQVVVVSTRQGRKGPSVAAWFAEQARQHGKFKAEIADLGDIHACAGISTITPRPGAAASTGPTHSYS